MSTKGSGIIYLHKSGFQLYSPLSTNLFEFHFVPEIVQDLEVINEDLLKELITIFITNNSIPSLSVVFVLADNACFVQDFSKDSTEQVEQFIDHVPFDTVASKTFPIPNGLRALATNQSLYDAIKAAFMEQGFVVDAILPALPFGEAISAKPTIDVSTAMLLLQKYNSFKEYNLTTNNAVNSTKKEEVNVSHETFTQSIAEQSDNGLDKKSEKKRLVILIGIFIFLVLILIVVYLNSQTPPPSAPAITKNATPQILSRSSSVAGISTSSAKILTNQLPNFSVQILNASDASVADLQDQLKRHPFKGVTIHESQKQEGHKAVIIFSPGVSIPARELIVLEVKKMTEDIVVGERADVLIDITIIINN